MRDTSLPSPGILSQGYLLRRTAAAAISACEITARVTPGGKTAGAAKLRTFFTACATALDAIVEVVLPTVTTRVRTAVNTAVITFNETLDVSTSVPLTSIVFTPARTVTAISVTGTTVTITATGVIAGDTITYTPPAAAGGQAGPDGVKTQGIKDRAGNLAATFTGVLA